VRPLARESLCRFVAGKHRLRTPVTLAVKKCSACGLDKSLTEFPARADSFDGRRSSCRDCNNNYYREWRQRRERPGNLHEAGPEPETQEAKEDAAEFGLFADMAAFGSPIQKACAEAICRLGTVTEACEELGLTPEQFRAHLSELRRIAAARGFSPGHGDATRTAPPGYNIRGISTQYGPGGEIMSQWVKTQKDTGDVATLLEAISDPSTWTGLADPKPLPDILMDEDLLNVFPIGDGHIGMLAWAAESGENFDLKIAEQNLFTAIDKLVSLAPPAKEALVINVGDFVHADGKSNTTTKGTPVDVDGRWSKIVAVAIRVLRRIVDRCLETHETVRLVNEIGNHDANTSIFLSLCLAQFYEREPRVIVDTSPAKFHWYRHGKCLIGITHGDTVKHKDLPGIMACDRAKDWGETEHRYWYTGHIHHDTLKELHGCKVESFRTMATSDAWHSGQGYRSGRDSKLITLHKEFGEIERYTVGIRQVMSILNKAAA